VQEEEAQHIQEVQEKVNGLKNDIVKRKKKRKKKRRRKKKRKRKRKRKQLLSRPNPPNNHRCLNILHNNKPVHQ
jgi:hypothetical protein